MTSIDPKAAAQSLAMFCREHHIKRRSLFGSMLSGTARPDSDIDLLVEFEPGMEPGLIGISAMEAEISKLYGGRKVDLRSPNDLSRHFRADILRTARLQYGA
ncbi:MAG: nucleotidyltransferase domain-containing protein [Burkholderiales bacterium]|nr:nucleotidyltransferase domain-containing protein [Burkholderiales bacterium]